jgi:hypothetical protein
MKMKMMIYTSHKKNPICFSPNLKSLASVFFNMQDLTGLHLKNVMLTYTVRAKPHDIHIVRIQHMEHNKCKLKLIGEGRT